MPQLDLNGPKPHLVGFSTQPGTYDIDIAGHVSNIVYIRWLEDLRVQCIGQFAPLQDLMAQGLIPNLVHTAIDYRRSVQAFEHVTAQMWIARLGRTSATLHATFYVGDMLCAQAEQVGVFVDATTGRPAEISRIIPPTAP